MSRSRPVADRLATEGLRWPFLLLLVGISGIGPVTLNGVLPATSAVMRDLDSSYAQAQLVLTVFLIATFFSQVVLGPAADRLGRRPVMIASLATFTLGSALCAMAPTIELLLAARFVQGFGGAVCVFLPRTIVRDAYGRDEAASVIGYMTTAMMVAPLFGPALGGWITDAFDWHWMYIGLAVIGGALTLLAARFQPETLGPAEPARDFRSATPAAMSGPSPRVRKSDPSGAYRILLAEPEFLALALVLAGSVGIYYSFLAGAPFVAMESRGLGASSYGAWFALVAVGYLAGNLVAGRLSARWGTGRMIRLGVVPLVLGVAAFWLLSGSTHPLALFLPMQLCAFSNGMALPNVMSAAMSVRPALSGSASGLAGSVQTGCGVALTVLIGLLLPLGDAWLFVVCTACTVVALAGVWLVTRGGRATPESASDESVSAARR